MNAVLVSAGRNSCRFATIARTFLPSLAILVAALSLLKPSPAMAVPYATALTNDAGTISFRREQIVAALKSYDNHLSERVVMCYHPGRIYHLGSRFAMLPQYYQGDVNGLITYRHMSNKVKSLVPRFPGTLNIDNVKVDYLVFDQSAVRFLPQFSFLLEKKSSRIPKNFRLIYLSARAAVYKVN